MSRNRNTTKANQPNKTSNNMNNTITPDSRACPICERPMSTGYQKIGDNPSRYVAWCLGVNAGDKNHGYISSSGRTELEAIQHCQKQWKDGKR